MVICQNIESVPESETRSLPGKWLLAALAISMQMPVGMNYLGDIRISVFPIPQQFTHHPLCPFRITGSRIRQPQMIFRQGLIEIVFQKFLIVFDRQQRLLTVEIYFADAFSDARGFRIGGKYLLIIIDGCGRIAFRGADFRLQLV